MDGNHFGMSIGYFSRELCQGSSRPDVSAAHSLRGFYDVRACRSRPGSLTGGSPARSVYIPHRGRKQWIKRPVIPVTFANKSAMPIRLAPEMPRPLVFGFHRNTHEHGSFRQSESRLSGYGVSEPLAENTRVRALNSDLSSRVVDFGSPRRRIGVPAHKMIVI